MSTVGVVGSFNRNVGVKILMDEGIDILSPDDVPLQQWLPKQSVDSIKWEWMEEELMPQTVAVASFTGTGPFTVTTPGLNDTDEIRVGDLLHVRDGAHTTQFLVDSITDGDTFVMSDFAGNTVDPVALDVLEIVGQFRDEGGAPPTARSLERVAKFNYTQIGQEAVEATRTQRKRAMYAQADPYTHETGKKFKELAIRTERCIVNGVRSVSGDAKRRTMGGLFYFISSNAQSGLAAALKANLNALIRKNYELVGGDGGVLMVAPAVRSAFAANIDPTLRRIDNSSTTLGQRTEKFLSDFGEVTIVTNRHFPKTKGLLLQREWAKVGVYDAYFHELLAKTKDGDNGEIVGEYTLEVKNEKAHGILTVTDAV